MVTTNKTQPVKSLSDRPVVVPESLLHDIVMIGKLLETPDHDPQFVAMLALIAGTCAAEHLDVTMAAVKRFDDHIAARVATIGYE